MLKERNAIVNAVAGSDKTRTALTAAIAYLESNRLQHVLLVAYNKRLQEDMISQFEKYTDLQERVLKHRLHKRTIHSVGRRLATTSSTTAMPSSQKSAFVSAFSRAALVHQHAPV